MENENVLTVDLGGDKIFRLHFQDFDTDVDVEALTQIDYNNVHAELITISSLLNKIGIWKAQVENVYSDAKLDRDIYEAKQAEYYRKTLKRTEKDKIKWPTVKEVENAVTLDEVVQNRRKRVIRMRKEADYIDSLYWAIKDKAKRLDLISNKMNLTPEDFNRELVSDKINGILIKAHKKKYTTK